jgi:hypothetical protein
MDIIERDKNIVSVSWPDHLWFGKGEGKLDTLDKVQKRMEIWKRKFKINKIHWRQFRTDLDGNFFLVKGYTNEYKKIISSIKWDDFQVVPEIAHNFGLKASYMFLFLMKVGLCRQGVSEKRAIIIKNTGNI